MNNATLEQLIDELANRPGVTREFLAKGDWMPYKGTSITIKRDNGRPGIFQ
jgi:hypothetical protein